MKTHDQMLKVLRKACKAAGSIEKFQRNNDVWHVRDMLCRARKISRSVLKGARI